MIWKILRKTQLNRLVLNISAPFCASAGSLPDTAQAERLLHALRPDPANSCICSRESKCSGDFQLDIIVPCYNVEKYLRRCIDSVLGQESSYSFRLILVDDGATDSSGQIIDSYCHDSRVLIKHQTNRGLSGARNTGLELSDAKYVFFLDSDDYLCPGAVEALMSCAEAAGAYIVEGAYNIVDTQGKVLNTQRQKAGQCGSADLYGYAWGKLFRTELFSDLCFPEDYWFEDSIMAQIIYPTAVGKKLPIYGVAEPVMCYTVNPAGITGTARSKPKSLDSLWITLQLYKDRQRLGLAKDQDYYEYILNMILLSARRAEWQSREVKTAMMVLWRDFLLREFPDFDTGRKKMKKLRQAVLEGNFRLFSLACKLI